MAASCLPLSIASVFLVALIAKLALCTGDSGNYCNGMAELCELQFDQVTLAGSHNAGSGFDGELILPTGDPPFACLYRNHNLNITAQLDLGVRVFEFDTCFVEECMDKFCPAGVWTCHNDAFAGNLEKAFRQIDEWMNSHPDQVCAISINDCYPPRYQTEIADGLYALFTLLWDPTTNRTTNGKLAMNTDRRSLGRWPTLMEAIESNQRIFVFIEPELMAQDELWMHDLPTSTFGEVPFNSLSMCEDLLFFARERCNLCDEMVQVTAFGSYGLCIWDMQQRCNPHLYNATDSCLTQRNEYGRTVNWIMVDFPDEAVSPNTAVEVARQINMLNLEFYLVSNSTPPTSQPPPGTCNGTKEGPDRPVPPTPTTSCEALEQIISYSYLGYFECTTNRNGDGSCSRLMCTVDVYRTGQLYTSEAVVRHCGSPPALELRLWSPTGELLGEEFFNETGILNVANLFFMITWNPSNETAGAALLEPDDSTTLIRYTAIPLDADCDSDSHGEQLTSTVPSILVPVILSVALLLARGVSV